MKTIKVNDIDITGLITSYQEYDEINANSDSNSIIGNTVSKQVKLVIDNRNGQLNGLFDSEIQIGDDIFLIYEKPEKWTKEISLTLYDKMILFNVAYKSTLDETATISEQLDEMATLSGVTIDKTSLASAVLNKVSSWYDNTVIIRNYLGFIAQCDGKNAYIQNGQVVFKPVASKTIECDFCSDYELIEEITYTRVCYDDGIEMPLSAGEPTGHTLYVSPNNSYIDQDDINRIYAMYNDLSFYSFKKFDTFEIDDLNLTDLIAYDGFTIMPLSIKKIVNGGEASDSYEMAGEITIKNADSIIVKDDPNTRIRRVQASINQLEGKYSVLAQNVDENTNQMAQLQLDYESFSTTISDKVDLLESSTVESSDIPPEDQQKLWMDTSIDPPQLKYWNEENEQWEVINDVNLTVQRVTNLEQTVNGWTYTWTDEAGNEHQEYVEGTSEAVKKIQRFIHLVDGNIILKGDDVDSALNLTSDEIFFSVNGKDLVTTNYEDISDADKPLSIDAEGRAKMNDLNIKERLTIGNFGFFPRSNGNLSFKKIK